MPTARALPIAADHREFTVKVDNTAVGREQHLVMVSITKAVNRISCARIGYLDGTASASDFPLSNSASFVPGTKIEILAGAPNKPASLFTGLVMRQALRVRDNAAPQLVVECRHAAAKLAVARRNAYYFNQTDSDVIASLLSRATISKIVEPTTINHPQQVQYRCTDWDYLLARADANGKLVFTNDGTVTIKAPNASATASAQLQFGATILELDAEIDARHQFTAVKALSWDPAQQTVVVTAGTDPGVAGPGNLTSKDLAAVVALDNELLHAAITPSEAKAWADSAWLKSELSKATGRIKCEGIGTVNPGDVVTLSGAGKRFSGDVFVTGVRHEYDLVQGWKTHIQFGALDWWAGEAPGVSAPKAAGLLPAVNGLQIGIVVDNEDTTGEHRVRVRLPLVDNAADGVWARVAAVDAGDQRGFFFRPELGDEVVVGCLDDDPRQAVILGMLHSSAKAPPLTATNDNHEKVYQSRAKLRVYFNDDTKILQLETPAGNRVTLSEDAKALTLEDQNGNTIEMTQSGVKIASAKAIELKAGTEVKIEAGKSLTAKGGTDLKLEGASGAELTSSATTKVQGSMVQIN